VPAVPTSSSTAAPVPLTSAGPATVGTALAAPLVADDGDGVLAHNGVCLDAAARTVDLDGAPVHLTRTEFNLLAALLAAPRRVLPKTELVRDLWPEDYGTGAMVTDADKRAVEVHIANLRRKLGDDASLPRFIETVRGTGYRLAPAR
jgi:DNA-binding response OmpR family regulator